MGDGGDADSTGAVAVVGLPSGVVGIAAGASHTCASTAEGSGWCWGQGNQGQLGVAGSHPSSSNVPKAVNLGTDIGEMAVGTLFTCALRKSDTRVACFGDGKGGSGKKSGIPFVVVGSDL
ncbi:MAG: hypothetical protein EXR79_08150 [Myxococcales bacterium]|nr:hypothetical protein [Myxococcales bacterium]